MPLVAATNISKTFGDRIILEGCSLSIEPGERIGIVGRNGGGKTTLLKIIASEVDADGGGISIQRGCRVGYLRQDPEPAGNRTLREIAASAFEAREALQRGLEAIYEKMADPSNDEASLTRLLREQERLDRELDAAGGYAVDHKIDTVLHGLGFTDAQFSIPGSGLSGGQRGRVALAKLLLEKPDVLLLDEPTNHLDIEGRQWLEDFLINDFSGAVAMISHDRYMLDRVVTRIVEIEQGRTIDYPGNYAAFRELRSERRIAMLRAYENQQTKFRAEEAYIRRYKAGQRAKQAKGRQSKLERAKESTLERPVELSTFQIELPKAERTGDIVISARGVSKSYPKDDGGSKVLFHDVSISVTRGERWAVIGPNGAGKSTLIRALLNELEPDAGVSKLGSNVRIGYYRQTHEHVDTSLTVIEYLQRVILRECPGKGLSEQAARDLAGAFLFSGDEQDRMLDSLSGGERSRAVIAGLLASAKNLIVLDEPTNHLDISSAERLEEALACDEDGDGYDGTLLLISHDRALIDATCDHLLVLDGFGNLEVFHGSYSEWHDKDVARRREQAREETEAKAREADRSKRKASEQVVKQKPAKPAPGASVNGLARMTMEKLEVRIQEIDTRVKEIDRQLAKPEVYRDHAKASSLAAERQRILRDLEPLEFEWSRRAESV